MEEKEFFIGWQQTAPGSYARRSRLFVMLTAVAAVLAAVLFVLGQRGFENSVFEFGKYTTLEGILTFKPVPMLKVVEADDSGKSTVRSLLLVGYGKHGALQALDEMAAAQGRALEGKRVRLTGSLIYNQYRTALELDEGEKAFAGWSDKSDAYTPVVQPLGRVSLRGEILDPKCALGVMKPGYGKPHRACAVRCISGGIPPILRMTDKNGKVNHCILLGPDGSAINPAVLDYVADQVRICGRLEQQDDWLVLYTDPASEIIRLQPYWLEGEMPMCN